jgi:hypothetical protein
VLPPGDTRRNEFHYGARFGDHGHTVLKDGVPVSLVYEVDTKAGIAWRYHGDPRHICCRQEPTIDENGDQRSNVGVCSYLDAGVFTVKRKSESVHV